jgi:hypothetical protein
MGLLEWKLLSTEHGMARKGRLFFVLTACGLAWALGLVGQGGRGKDAEGSRYVATGDADAAEWPIASQADR